MSTVVALIALAAASAVPMPPATVPSAALKRATASLDTKSQCVPFNWIVNDKGSARGAITVPVVMNGRPLRMQLDTGADVTSLYGHLAEQASWSKTGSKTFRAARFTVADTRLDRPTIYVNSDMEADPTVQGTLGLPALLGKVVVLDYPGKRLCLFAEADVPAAIAEAPSVRAMLRNSKLYVPLSIGAFASDAFVFDTGSSELPLNVDLATWRTLTNRVTTEGAPTSYQGSAWGKPLIIPGAPSASPVSIGKIVLGRVTVFTNPAQPTGFTDWPVQTVGVLGNAPVWDGIVVLDLTARVRFSIIH
ncbi:hypothetical protein GCM10008023_40420 [Sphingomonas glacialis]|uniref:Peptidase A2 domain-containing protein n=1 Tax=Sphingomonas glacialis TaxID=658225 RepID=A0ABQ3LUN1_9SPHN|nr:retropepsin-like aspartic protease [Sphingomonas glacialis]GHH26169.1 hypothetical protein GCM10008023_40420 [Sphingomonas glacialis]